MECLLGKILSQILARKRNLEMSFENGRARGTNYNRSLSLVLYRLFIIIIVDDIDPVMLLPNYVTARRYPESDKPGISDSTKQKSEGGLVFRERDV